MDVYTVVQYWAAFTLFALGFVLWCLDDAPRDDDQD